MNHLKKFGELNEFEREMSDPPGFKAGAQIIFKALGKNLKGKIVSITDERILAKDEIGGKHEIQRKDIIYPPFFQKYAHPEKEPVKQAAQAVEENVNAGKKKGL